MVLPRVGMALFALLSLLVALMSLRVLVQSVDQAMPHVMQFLQHSRWSLWAHILGAPLALLLAPVQLWTGLRRRAPVLHRLSGRLFALVVVVAAPSGFALAASAESQASGFARAGFMVLAVLWMVTTAMGVLRARQGAYAAHRWWMERALALTFAAVTLRLIMVPLIAFGWTVAETYDVTAWGSWVLNLAALELWQARRRHGAAMV